MGKELYPLRFLPIPLLKPWGGTALAEKFGKRFSGAFSKDELTGESWELVDMAGNVSVVSDGPLAGQTISALMKEYRERIAGAGVFGKCGTAFPLLIKFLNIEGKLSVQVHPDDEKAEERYGQKGKSEVWYVLDAAPDARIYMGFNKQVTPEEFCDACKSGTADRLLNVIHPKAGDAIFIKPGTVHSAQGGIVLCEIQAPSDLTLRLYDWGRELDPSTARKMHLAEALDIIDFKKYDGSGFSPAAVSTKTNSVCIAHCPQFTVNHLTLYDEMGASFEGKERFAVYNCIKGEIVLRQSLSDGSQGWRCHLLPGDTVLLPAECTGYVLDPVVPGSELLQSTLG